MIAAIYARKSTDQSGVADDQKSVTRQVDHARAYAATKGWIVPDAYVFVDDGISGAEFTNRPGFVRLMNAVRPKPPFQALIMSEESRLGREAIETAYALKQLVTSGGRVFFYLEDRERTLESPTDKVMLSLTTFADELEREKARLRVTDAMLRKARAGYSCGAPCFGYDNVPVLDDAGRRSHVERRINDREAAIVCRIFELCASGVGYTRLAKLLNEERALAPRPKRDRPRGWAPTSVKEILDRRLYLGEVTWNRTRKRDSWGQKRLSHRSESDWVRVAAPALRIVSDAQWSAAHARLTSVRERLQETGALGRRVIRDLDSKYLLTGFARCAVCGGGLGVVSGSHRSDRRHVYGCLSYHKRGTAVCGNQLRLPLDQIDRAVLATLAGDVLRPAVVLAVIDGVLDHVTPASQTHALEHLRGELRTVDHAIANLARAIGVAGDLSALLDELRAARTRRDALVSRMHAFERIEVGRFDRARIEARVHAHLSDWQALLATKQVQDGRRLLRETLAGPIRFTPDGRTYRFAGEATFGGVLAGMADVATCLVAVRGIEPRSRG